jgi:cytoskeletal protein CcmA (bactofilin family)
VTKLKIICSTLLAALFLLGGPAPAQAARFVARDSVNINRAVTDDLYVSGGSVSIDAPIDGDLVVSGGRVEVAGPISGNLYVAGGEVTVTGRVDRTVRVAGGNLRLNGTVGRDLLLAGGRTHLGRGAVVGGDLVAAAGELRLLGRIDGGLLGSAGQVVIDGPIGENARLKVDRLELRENADVGGDLRYRSANEARIDDRAQVGGRIERQEPARRAPGPLARFLLWLASLLGIVIVGLLIAWLFPETLLETKQSLAQRPWASLGLGAAVLFLTPLVLILVAVTIIGLPLAVIALALYGIGIYLANVYAAAAVGSLVLDRLAPGGHWIGVAVVVGLVALSLVRIIPVIGGLIGFAVILFGLGAMSLAGRRSWWTPRE